METQNTQLKKNGFGKWALIIAIVVVLNLFFNYAVSLVYRAPAWEDYVPNAQVVEPVTNKDDCLNVGGQWTEDGIPDQGRGYCNSDYTKQREFDAAQKNYNRNIFAILVVLGVLSLVLGTILGNPILALALGWGGVLSLVIASIRYFGDADNLFKVLILAAALGALVWVAVRKFEK